MEVLLLGHYYNYILKILFKKFGLDDKRVSENCAIFNSKKFEL